MRSLFCGKHLLRCDRHPDLAGVSFIDFYPSEKIRRQVAELILLTPEGNLQVRQSLFIR